MGATGALSLLQLGTGYSQSQAQLAEGEYQKSIFDINAKFADIQAEDAIKRGKKEAIALKTQAKKLIGSQRASLAAQGIDIESGSALDVQADTAELSEVDAMTIKNNAWKEAWGYRVQALDLRSRGQFAQLSAQNRARNTLLTSGIQAYQTYDSGKKSAMKLASSVAGGA